MFQAHARLLDDPAHNSSAGLEVCSIGARKSDFRSQNLMSVMQFSWKDEIYKQEVCGILLDQDLG